MKIISWNLNGLNATLSKNPFNQAILDEPDILCFQEIKTLEEPVILPGYAHFFNHAKRKGYSGTALLSKKIPLKVQNGFISDFLEDEGRIITGEYKNFYVINVYVPNAQKGLKGGLKRHSYRLKWDLLLKDHVALLMQKKPVILCGDFNVARSKLDYYEQNMHQYWLNQGYVSDEQSSVEDLLELGLIDVFRSFYPQKRSYTWWSNRFNKRSEDRGFRLDYFFISRSILKNVIKIKHLSSIQGSDHCPIELEVAI